MKNILIILSSLFLLQLVSSCSKENSKILCVKVVTSTYGEEGLTGVEDMEVLVQKRKENYFLGSSEVDSYSDKTDSLGYCNILVDDYDDQYYYYNIDVNKDLLGNAESGNDVYSYAYKVVRLPDFDSTITIRLTRIPH